MFKLLTKDLKANRDYLLLLYAILAAISLGFCQAVKNDMGLETEAYVLAVILSSMIASKLFIMADEAGGTINMSIASLPVTRKQLVLARYLSSFSQILLAMGLHLVLVQLSASEKLMEEAAFIFRPEMWIVSFILLVLSDAFTFPFYFKYGFMKGAIIYGITLVSLMILTIILINLLGVRDMVPGLIRWVSAQQPWMVFATLIISILIILGTSIFISINVYKNKDL